MKKSFVVLSLFLSLAPLYAFKSSAQNMDCDCEKIIEAKKCDNPNCIKICSLLHPMSDISSRLANMCLGEENRNLTFKKERVSAGDISSVSGEIKTKILETEKASKQSLEENCPQCQLISNISAHFKVNAKEKTCPSQYLKTHHYKEYKRGELTWRKKTCKKKKLLKHFEKYTKKLISGKSEDSIKLWEACPEPCSFEVSYTVKVDNEPCQGLADIRVDCTHKVNKDFFGIPMYDLNIQYKGTLKCEEVEN